MNARELPGKAELKCFGLFLQICTELEAHLDFLLKTIIVSM